MADMLGPGRCPPEILAALREIDAAADLIHLGGDAWLLGVRRANPPARQQLERLLKQATGLQGHSPLERAERAIVEAELAKEIRVLQLCADGFRPIQLYTTPRPDPAIVADFRLRDHNWRTRPEAAFRELADEISFDVQDRKRTNLVREFWEQEGRSIWHKVLRGARSFLQPRRVADTTPPGN